MGLPPRHHARLHLTRKAYGKSVHRGVQRQAARRVPQRSSALVDRRREEQDRSAASRLQLASPAQLAGSTDAQGVRSMPSGDSGPEVSRTLDQSCLRTGPTSSDRESLASDVYRAGGLQRHADDLLLAKCPIHWRASRNPGAGSDHRKTSCEQRASKNVPKKACIAASLAVLATKGSRSRINKLSKSPSSQRRRRPTVKSVTTGTGWPCIRR